MRRRRLDTRGVVSRCPASPLASNSTRPHLNTESATVGQPGQGQTICAKKNRSASAAVHPSPPPPVCFASNPRFRQCRASFPTHRNRWQILSVKCERHGGAWRTFPRTARRSEPCRAAGGRAGGRGSRVWPSDRPAAQGEAGRVPPVSLPHIAAAPRPTWPAATLEHSGLAAAAI